MNNNINALLADATAQINTYDVAEALDRLGREDVLFVDVHDEPELRSDGKIPAAFHASRGMLEYHIDPASPYHNALFDEQNEFVFYCKSGGRSALAPQRAQEMGLAQVASMNGGLTAWREHGGPAERV